MSAATMGVVPLGVWTRMWKLPALWVGDTAVILPAETTLKLCAATPPKVTAVAPRKLVPRIVTVWPPPSCPALGETEVIAGGKWLPIKRNNRSEKDGGSHWLSRLQDWHG